MHIIKAKAYKGKAEAVEGSIRGGLPESKSAKMVQLFSVPAFFILFRETLEASIILSVMMALINKMVEDAGRQRKMKKQVWMGVVVGVGLCMAAAAIFLSLYYTVAKEAWDKTEALWEGILGLVAVLLITLMAFSMIRVDTWRDKWERKLTKVTVDAVGRVDATTKSNVIDNVDDVVAASKDLSFKSRYALFLIPFTVVLREGVEAVIFLGGIGLEGSGTAYPIPAIVGAACGILCGYLLYRGGNKAAFKVFLGAATLLLLVIAAGLFAGSVHEFEEYTDNEHFIWKLKCCNPGGNNFWSLLNAIVGWRNEATTGTLSAYILYWVFVVVALFLLRIKWRRQDAATTSRVDAASSPSNLV